MKSYQVKSIFGPTLQGEGSHAGTCVVFLRLAGCNRWTGLEKDRENAFCKFCDTDFRGGKSMNVQEILNSLTSLGGPKRLVISGGEPTLQIDRSLLSSLRANGYEIHLETNGSRPLGELLSLIDHITMSPKQSLSATKLECCDDLKILFPLPSPFMAPENFKPFPAKRKFLQPVMDETYESNLRETIAWIYRNPDWRLSLQTHKILGVE